jgi:addiction module RelB/DinJ family antitoxin
MLSVKADRTVKARAQRLASDLGLSLSAVVNAYLRQFIRNQEVHFSIPPQMTGSLERLLGKVEHDVRRSRNLSPSITTVRALRRHLSSV